MNRLSCDAVIYGFCRILSGGFCLNGWKLTVGMLETWLRNGGNLSPECWKLQAGIGGNFAPEFAYNHPNTKIRNQLKKNNNIHLSNITSS